MICTNCNRENSNIATFCCNCGQKIHIEKDDNYTVVVKKISVFFFILLAYICVINFTSFGRNYSSLLITDAVFAIIVLAFLILNFKSVVSLFKLKRHNGLLILKLLITAPLLALVVNFLGKNMNQEVFDTSEFIYYNQFKDSPAPLLFSIISIGIFPAVFEEIAFRGIFFNQSLKIMGLKPTIFITSILFTILHISLVSVLWIFPFGLFLGYLRAKHRTLIYGMIFHFAYNTSIILIQIVLL